METGYRIYDVMTVNPIKVTSDKSVRECAELMKEEDVGSLLIVDGKSLLGLITNDDLVRGVVAENKSNETKVKEVMVSDIISAHPDDDIFEALKKMRDYNINLLPVLDDEGNLSGLVTLKDILKIEPQLFEVMADRIKLREYKRKLKSISENDDVLDECELCGARTDELYEFEGNLICHECKSLYENNSQ